MLQFLLLKSNLKSNILMTYC